MPRIHEKITYTTHRPIQAGPFTIETCTIFEIMKHPTQFINISMTDISLVVVFIHIKLSKQ
jgi:hypothetical protein